MYVTYILQSESTNRLYIGQTNDLQDRLIRHNNNHNKATKNRGPWRLIFFKEFNTRREAVVLERKLKAFKNPMKVLKWIDSQVG